MVVQVVEEWVKRCRVEQEDTLLYSASSMQSAVQRARSAVQYEYRCMEQDGMEWEWGHSGRQCDGQGGWRGGAT